MKLLLVLLIITACSYALDCYNCNSEEKGCGETSFLQNKTGSCGGACLKLVMKIKSEKENAVFRGCSELTGVSTCGILAASIISEGEIRFCELCSENLCNNCNRVSALILLSIITLFATKIL